MPVPTETASWWGSLLWLLGLTVVAFEVAWLSGTRLHIRKGPYIPLLLLATAGLAAGYVLWLGVGVREVLTARWVSGVVAGLVIGAVLAVPALQQPVDRPVHGTARWAALGWEGVVYGTAEGLLLSGLPPFMAWQAIHSLGWSGTAGTVALWGIPLVASVAVIVIHHLGYWSYRSVRKLMPVAVALTVLSAGFLLTGSWLTPVVAHIVLHGILVGHGSEMPPHDRPASVPQVHGDLVRAA